ncbi:hypothetical protein [Rhodococcus olei]|uniref:hypothetical protein n=1 Tax=Rhodococcus olei TaxID=2161675 RepID=UPI0031F018B4
MDDTDLPGSAAAEKLFERYQGRLLFVLEYETPVGLPRDSARAWARALGAMSFADPPGETLRVLAVLDWELWNTWGEVARGHGDRDPSFVRGMVAIQRGLTGMRQIMVHVGFPDVFALPDGTDD